MTADNNTALAKSAFLKVIPLMLLIGGIVFILKRVALAFGMQVPSIGLFAFLAVVFSILIRRFIAPINKAIAEKRMRDGHKKP